MQREKVVRLYLGLVESVISGVVTDVLWTGGSAPETVFEMLHGELDLDDALLGDLDALAAALRKELRKDDPAPSPLARALAGIPVKYPALATKIAEALEEHVDDPDLLGGMLIEQSNAEHLECFCYSEGSGDTTVEVHMTRADGGKKMVVRFVVQAWEAA